MRKELENFSYNIVYLRKKYGFSKKHMAKLMGIGVGSLNKLEDGVIPARLTIDVFFNLHKAFGIKPADQLKERADEKIPPLGEEEV